MKIRGIFILGTRIFVAPPVEYDAYTQSDLNFPKDIKDTADLINNSRCAEVSKDDLDSLENYYFGKEDTCEL